MQLLSSVNLIIKFLQLFFIPLVQKLIKVLCLINLILYYSTIMYMRAVVSVSYRSECTSGHYMKVAYTILSTPLSEQIEYKKMNVFFTLKCEWWAC